MDKIIELILPEEEHQHQKFRQLTLFLVVCLGLSLIFMTLRTVLVGFTIESLPSIFGAFVISSLLLGIYSGLAYSSVSWFFGVTIFIIISIAAVVSRGIQGPFFHLLILCLFYFPYFIGVRKGLWANFIIVAWTMIVQWLSMEVHLDLMIIGEESISWVSRSFFIFRMTIFVAFIKILTPPKSKQGINVMVAISVWFSWLALIYFFPEQISWLQCLIYPLLYYILPRLDWEFQIVFLAANVMCGFLYTIHLNPAWVPGVAWFDGEIWGNFLGVIGGMSLIFMMQLRDFRGKLRSP